MLGATVHGLRLRLLRLQSLVSNHDLLSHFFDTLLDIVLGFRRLLTLLLLHLFRAAGHAATSLTATSLVHQFGLLGLDNVERTLLLHWSHLFC